MATDEAVGQTSGRADGAEMPRTVGRMGAERVRTVERTGGRAEEARIGPRRCGRGPARADGRSGGLGGRGLHCANGGSGRRVDWAVGAGRATVGRTGRTGGRGVCWSGEQADGRMGGLGRTGEWADGRMGGWADGRTSGRAGGPRFKRPHSTRLGSLLGAQSACLVRARVRRVPGSVVGSSTIPRQTPVLSARTHLPRLSASVLGAEKYILLFRYKNGFTQGRWQRDAKSTASTSCTKGRRWRWGQEKAKSGGFGARRVPQPGVACVPRMGAAAAAMVSSHGHEVCRIPPLQPLVATHFTRTALQIEGCKILAS